MPEIELGSPMDDPQGWKQLALDYKQQIIKLRAQNEQLREALKGTASRAHAVLARLPDEA